MLRLTTAWLCGAVVFAGCSASGYAVRPVPRIAAEFLEQERRALGESWFKQEYQCSFEALEGLGYPDFKRCVIAGAAPEGGRRIGGIDFGFRNPFAAVWGVVKDDVLILTGEHYSRGKPLSHHAA